MIDLDSFELPKFGGKSSIVSNIDQAAPEPGAHASCIIVPPSAAIGD